MNKYSGGFMDAPNRRWDDRIPHEFARRIMDLVPFAFLILDRDGVIEFASSHYLELEGISKTDVVGKKITESLLKLVPWNSPEDAKRFLAFSTEWTGEASWQTKDGEVRWGLFHFIPVNNGDNNVKRYLLTNVDITAQKNTAEILARNEERLRSILCNVNEYIYSVEYRDGIAIKTYHSPRCFDISGYYPADFADDPELWHKVVHPDDRMKVTDFFAAIESVKNISYIEHRIVTNGNNVRWVSNSCAVHRDALGQILRLDGFIQDITERRESINQLRKLSIAVEQSPSSVVITDRDGNIEYVNPKFSKLTGYSLNEAMGQNPRILKSGQMNSDQYKNMWDTISSGEEWHGEFHNKKKNGELYWEFASISPLRNSHNEITHYIGVKEDITARKIVEEAYRNSEEKLRIRNEIMEGDLKYAQRVQRALLPTDKPLHDKIRIAFKHLPLDLVGGDYFSFLKHGRQMRVFIGDVSGHGVPAALFLSLIRFASESISHKNGRNPSAFLAELNGVLCRYMQNYFVTALYGVFDPRKDGSVRLSIASGGHPPAVIHRTETGQCESVRGKGSVLGVLPDVKFESCSVRLDRGDRVFFFTDGIPETRNENYDLIGYDKMEELICRSSRLTLEETLDAIIDEVHRFRGGVPIEDDIVVIGCEIL
jgi:sigma-B regulation protein RsbU (phosphoserine phosphatase)